MCSKWSGIGRVAFGRDSTCMYKSDEYSVVIDKLACMRVAVIEAHMLVLYFLI